MSPTEWDALLDERPDLFYGVSMWDALAPWEVQPVGDLTRERAIAAMTAYRLTHTPPFDWLEVTDSPEVFEISVPF